MHKETKANEQLGTTPKTWIPVAKASIAFLETPAVLLLLIKCQVHKRGIDNYDT